MKVASRKILFAVLVTLQLLPGCAGMFGGDDKVKEEPKEDAVIATRVKAKLIEAGDLDAAAIKVESDQGVVRLSGFVGSEQQRQRAAALAQSVSGVKRVDNTIEVK